MSLSKLSRTSHISFLRDFLHNHKNKVKVVSRKLFTVIPGYKFFENGFRLEFSLAFI